MGLRVGIADAFMARYDNNATNAVDTALDGRSAARGNGMTSTPKGDGSPAQPGDASALATAGEVSPMEPELNTTAAVLDIGVQGHLGRHLRAHYAALINERVPDNLLRLLHDLALERTPPVAGADSGDDT